MSALRWRAECLDCPTTIDIDWGHRVPVVYYEAPARAFVDSWVRQHRISHQSRDGSIPEIKVSQVTTIKVNVESLNEEILDKLFARSN